MLTYKEYHSRMLAVQNILNAAADHASINITGLTPHEASLFIVGKYIQALSSATPAFFPAKLSMPVSMLIHIMRNFSESKTFDFSLLDEADVASDPELENDWKAEYICYTRMQIPIVVGKAASIGIFEAAPSPDVDFNYWCNLQALHLANYCVAHDINFAHLADMV